MEYNIYNIHLSAIFILIKSYRNYITTDDYVYFIINILFVRILLLMESKTT